MLVGYERKIYKKINLGTTNSFDGFSPYSFVIL